MSTKEDTAAERRSWVKLREAWAEEGVGYAKAWARRLLSDTPWRDDLTLAAVKGNVKKLMELVERQEAALRVQGALVLKMRDQCAAAREIIRRRKVNDARKVGERGADNPSPGVA